MNFIVKRFSELSTEELFKIYRLRVAVFVVEQQCAYQELGTKIVEHAIAFAKEQLGAGEIVIEAQTYVRGLYEKLGFRAESEEFLEDGIPHVRMRLLLKKT